MILAPSTRRPYLMPLAPSDNGLATAGIEALTRPLQHHTALMFLDVSGIGCSPYPYFPQQR